MSNNTYTDEQKAFILKLREAGYNWQTVSAKFNDEFGLNKSHDTLRMAIKASTPDKSKKVTRLDQTSRKYVDNDTVYNRLLIISDTHIPYHHPDLIPFLEAIKRKYRPDGVVHIGDEVDKHAMSFHDSDPDLPSAGDELEEAISYLTELYELFPKVMLVDSNHGSMVYRKGKHHGIPRKYLRDYGDVLEAPKGWTWDYELNLRCGDNHVKFRHQFSKNALAAARQLACCVVQGHHHTTFDIQYSANSDRLIWAMTVSCLIDDDALAFNYNKVPVARPIIGCGIILDGLPQLIPMVLSKGGRWIGKL